ncbi:MAG: ATPase [Gemmatales bacterium]|nr:MAG: ATPase [Gemmatales bacterium]
MIHLIEALNYRCLRYVRQRLGSFHVLIGPNASGKTTFLDVISFLSSLVWDGPENAIRDRTQVFEDLVWSREGKQFELAVEAIIPEDRKKHLAKKFEAIRYEVRVGLDPKTDELGILEEKAWLKPLEAEPPREPMLFPIERQPPNSILTGKAEQGWQRILSKAPGGNDNFYVEVRKEGSGKGWFPSIRLGPRKSALGNLPEDERKFPVSTWFKDFLAQNVQTIVLNSLLIRKASPPGQVRSFKPDGSNLPWVISELEKTKHFRNWIAHVATALPDVEGIRTIERADDKHRYLVIRYKGGLEVPSWMASDGTLRFLALTILAYLSEFKGVYLIEEPENGIHPSAVESVYQSLSSVYDAQVLLATHSPVILGLAEPDKVLCFKKTESGATDIVLGSEHPGLRNWKGEIDLGTLFAGGVLG